RDPRKGEYGALFARGTQEHCDDAAVHAATSAFVMRPSLTCTVLEQRAATVASCVTTTSVRPCPVVDHSSASITSAEVCESSAPVGSSAKTSSAPVTCARAIATRCA